MPRSHGRRAVLAVVAPFRSGLRVHVRVGVRVAVSHLRVGRIRRVLAVGVSRTWLSNGGIYRHLGVRIDTGGLMVSCICLGH